jgi:hypothetical protein
MSTVSRDLPAHPHLDVPKKQAQELLSESKKKLPDALDRLRRRHPRFQTTDDDFIANHVKLSDAQMVIAREYGFTSWTILKKRITGNTVAQLIDKAIRGNDHAAVKQLLTAYPGLLDVPVVSGNWGPPLSHAANLGRLDMVKTIASLGAKDVQHAFDRALLHGDLEVAGWLHEQGGSFTPGIIMGACETLNDRGFGFLDDAGVPLTDAKGDRLAPLALVLETYSRNSNGKHAILRRFQKRGYQWEDSPMMAFHCGDQDRLQRHLQNDPQLFHRRFSYREIYPPELGCADDNRSGLHGTPIGGTTLLHLSIDFDEREIFDWLLDNGADVNAAAAIDEEGFGGHTPLFNAMLSKTYAGGRQHTAYMIRRLLAQGAAPDVRVDLRKYLDWRDEPGWHIAKNVTPLEWANSFPENHKD